MRGAWITRRKVVETQIALKNRVHTSLSLIESKILDGLTKLSMPVSTVFGE